MAAHLPTLTPNLGYKKKPEDWQDIKYNTPETHKNVRHATPPIFDHGYQHAKPRDQDLEVHADLPHPSPSFNLEWNLR